MILKWLLNLRPATPIFRSKLYLFLHLSDPKLRDFQTQHNMSITPQKKEFLQHIAGGLSTLVNCSMLADEIYTLPDDGLEKYIKDNMLVGSSFSDGMFCDAIETIEDQTLAELLKYFDDKDMSIANAFIESCLTLDDLPPELHKFQECIDFGEVNTFEDFLEL